MAHESPPPYWALISVLFSTRPLTPTLAMDLYHLAHRLHFSEELKGEIKSELARGVVENTKREVVVGFIAGPMFEAELDTEKGKATARFVLTREGLELGPKPVPRELMN